MEIKIFTSASAEAAEAMRVQMELLEFNIIVVAKADVISVASDNLIEAGTVIGFNSWVVVGQK